MSNEILEKAKQIVYNVDPNFGTRNPEFQADDPDDLCLALQTTLFAQLQLEDPLTDIQTLLDGLRRAQVRLDDYLDDYRTPNGEADTSQSYIHIQGVLALLAHLINQTKTLEKYLRRTNSIASLLPELDQYIDYLDIFREMVTINGIETMFSFIENNCSFFTEAIADQIAQRLKDLVDNSDDNQIFLEESHKKRAIITWRLFFKKYNKLNSFDNYFPQD